MDQESLKGFLMATIPHSGEEIPPEAKWLQGLDEITLMGDVDRYVDRLYEPSLLKLKIPYVKTQWHRYAADLNRLDSDIDAEAVLGNPNPAGTHPRGFHWVYSTQGEKILHEPLTQAVHQMLVDRVYHPFHQNVQALAQSLLNPNHSSDFNLYHLDLHSMPSKGTAQHRDPGEYRKDLVVSDSLGKSCSSQFKDLVMGSLRSQGFSIAYNWPYFGGRLTEHYGQPQQQRHHVVQIELNRALYMDERTKQLNTDTTEIESKLYEALRKIQHAIVS